LVGVQAHTVSPHQVARRVKPPDDGAVTSATFGAIAAAQLPWSRATALFYRLAPPPRVPDSPQAVGNLPTGCRLAAPVCSTAWP
jgi:hypothetical protein